MANTPLCNRAGETRPSGFFPSPTENFASLVRGEISFFTRPVCGFPGSSFTYPAYITFVCLKKAKQRLDRKGKPGGKFAASVKYFSESLVRI